MVLGWRRAFCTSVPKDQERDSPIIKEKSETNPSLSIGSRFGGFFSNPSTPRMQSQPVFSPTLRCRTTANTPSARPAAVAQASSAPQSPKLRCKTRIAPRFFNRSTPSSPRSPSFSLLKSSLRLSKNRCEICLERLKTGQGTAIFTAECRHSFHFPCIAAQVRKQCSLTCPICNSTWKEIHLSPSTPTPTQNRAQDFEQKRDVKKSILKVYNDDEPLSSPTSGARFNPIPESDEYEDRNDEFPGFFAANNVVLKELEMQKVEFGLLSETAVVSVGKCSETYAVVLKIRAPEASSKHARRASIDLVTVVNVGRSMNSEKIHLMKKAMRTVVSSLTAADRFSIVAFSSTSKRLLPLRRMTTAGKKAARRIIDAIIPLDDSATSAMDSLKKAAKVIEDRREKNPAAAIMLFSDGHRGGSAVSHSLFSEIPLHSVKLSVGINELPDETLAKCITNSLSIVIQDLKFQLGFTPDSAPGEVSAVYSSHGGRPTLIGSGQSWCMMGDLCSDEEREVLIELKVQSPFAGGATVAHRRLSVRCQYKDPSTQELIHDKEGAIAVPCPRVIGSASTRESQRLRCLFVTTRALAESRRMADRSDIAGAYHMLASARALILQSGSGSGEEFVRGLEAELSELSLRRHDQAQQRRNNHEREAEPLTPTSAWRAAERLAKLAIMKKSLNRVSDLHGFENARF
ncbi:E3 ubiquitin-protein ligase WAVH1-like isoform X2 [Henckelia pumila]|uniref:E3 ubiquitin-protein ligase WAVH1-like isoform X2 n=1 Tax=Henckelia pumila TaxID=405737 RepID=UPI003C6DC283